jgi:hypothetical protein
MRLLTTAPAESRSGSWTLDVMRDELSHALLEAMYELEALPRSPEGAMIGLYAIMDDLQEAVRRTEALDVARSA